MVNSKAAIRLMYFFRIAVFLFIGACSSNPPVEDYALARTALEAARDKDAARYAPNYWHRAEEAYRKGEQNFINHEYKIAEELFVEAKLFAEKAENAARLQKHKSGEFSP